MTVILLATTLAVMLLFSLLARAAPTPPARTPDGLAALPGDSVYDLAFEGTVLWAATAEGAIVLDTLDESFTVYTSTHGLPYDDPRAVGVAPDGDVWFGTEAGASCLDGTT
jgi:streptogramin lyase